MNHATFILSAVQILHPGCRVLAIRELTLSSDCQQRLNARAMLRDLRYGQLNKIAFHLRGWIRGFLKT